MRAAKKCGVKIPEVTLLDFGKPVLAVERFDRVVTIDEEGLRVERIYQEDFSIDSAKSWLWLSAAHETLET